MTRPRGLYFAISATYCLTVGSFANCGDAGSFRYWALIEPLTRSALELRTAAPMNVSVAETELR